ncbi:MAG: glycosyltransferase family 4 protein [Sphaerochaeta sp.]
MGRKICFISGVISRSGGTERVGSIIANELCQRGYDINILSFWNQGAPYYPLNPNIRVDYLLNPGIEGKLSRTGIYQILKLHRYLVKNNIDIVVDIDTVLSRHTAYAIQGTKCKLVSWEHFNYWAMEKLNERRRFRAKKLIKKYASKLVVLTEEDRLKHIHEYNLNPDFVVTMPNPCLMDASVDYHYDNKIFLVVGRLAEEKNFAALLTAWSLIQEKCNEWKVIIVGKGELEEKLKKQADALNLKNIVFAGHSDNVWEYFKDASCYVLSSDYEGFPMVILEAQSFGLPVISFDCKTGPHDLVYNDINGYLVEDKNVEQLAEKMLLFTQNRSKAIQMSDEAVKGVQQYNLENIINRWCELLDKVFLSK